MTTPMQKSTDGGPAFPLRSERQSGPFETEVTTYFGMSIRDWFAGHALAGILASLAGEKGQIPNIEKSVAESAYDYADAMLKAREVPHA